MLLFLMLSKMSGGVKMQVICFRAHLHMAEPWEALTAGFSSKNKEILALLLYSKISTVQIKQLFMTNKLHLFVLCYLHYIAKSIHWLLLQTFVKEWVALRSSANSSWAHGGAMIGCHLCNKSSGEISSQLNIPQSTVRNLVTKWKAT